jgi:hypothetical protein
MAPLIEALPQDVNNIKFMGVMVDDGGNNKLLPLQGGAKQTLNGEDVAPLMITPTGNVQVVSSQLPGVVAFQSVDTDTVIVGAAAKFLGFYVSASSSGTIAIYDGTTNGGTVLLDTQSVVAGQLVAFPWPIPCGTGIFVEIVDCTVTVFSCPA